MKKFFVLLLIVLGGGLLFSWRILQTTNGQIGNGPITLNSASASAASSSNQSGAAGPTGVQTNLTPGGTASAIPARPQRKWDPDFFDRLHDTSPGQPILFELVGEEARGVIRYMDRKNGQVIYVTGELNFPEAGRFFFQKQSEPGKAGDFFGVVEFPASKVGYRVEPAGDGSGSVLVRLPLDQVICLAMPAPDPDLLGAEEIPPLEPSDFPDYPIPDYQDGIIPLQSLPGSTTVLYIDYRGGYTPTWGGITYERPNVSNAQIRDVWKRVAEDYMPFNINVTTDIKVYQNAPETTRQRVICTPTTTAAPGAGGVAYMNSWNSSGDTPCWSFYSTGKSAAEVISHEIGHTLQLGHDGRITPDEGYYGGHGSGEVGWAPIMGVGYYQNVAQWSKGEYLSANNTQDDLAIIVANNNNVDYRADDAGPVLATSRYLEVYSNNTAQAEGVISTTGDTDAFQFTTSGGVVALRANPVGDWANLAMSVTLCNSNDVVISSNNPQTTLWANISTSVGAGTYTFRVTGVGRNNPLNNGFTSYASLGYYTVSGSVANARQSDRFSIPENTPNGTLVGAIPANNPNGSPLSYVITGGNSNSTFSVDNLGQLRVINSGVLNYETLGSATQLPVQFELFVNINNLNNTTLTEVKRRVVVAITDINEAPATSNLNISVLEHSQPGTLLGKISGADPDFYNLLAYSIVSGDANGMFTVGNQSGELRVAGDLSRAVQSAFQLRVAVSDNVGPVSLMSTSVVSVTVLPNATPFRPGSINYAIYTNLPGTLVSALTSSAVFPSMPASEKATTSFEGDTDRGDNYGSVMRGYLIPPASGSYTFWIASDDNSDLRISTTTNPATATVIASINGSSSWTAPREWGKYASQRSAARTLTAGQGYYIEARHKEGTGGDNLAVGWTGPGMTGTNVIAGAYLAPYSVNYLPRATGFAREVRRDAFPGFRVGRIVVADANAGDSHLFSITSGDSEGIFGVDSKGWITITNTMALQSTLTPSFVLSVRGTDSGSPPLSATADATISITEPDVMPAAVQREMFKNIGGGTAVSDLTSNSKYPGKVDEFVALTSFSAAVDVGDNFGSRVRAYLVPPIDGAYRFYIASDDASQLKLSTSTNPASASVIASVATYSSPGVYTKEAGQTSGLRTLVGGQRYYVEALQKEGGGGDHLSVAWTLPGTTETNVIDAAYLEPFDLGIAPQFANQTLGVFATAINGVVIGRLNASDSPLDTLTFQILSGNTNNTFDINPATGDVLLVDNSSIADGSISNFTLGVAVQDSGCGGLYPLRTAQATISINVISTNSPLVWLGSADVNRWSDPGNWGGIVPYDGARLIFGLPSNLTNVNDVLTQVSWVRLTNGGFNISGNPLAIQSGLTNAGNNTWNINTTLGAPQPWNNLSGTLAFNGALDTAGFNLSLAAAGDIRLAGTVSGAGSISKSGAGRLLMSGSHPLTGVLTVAAAGGTANALENSGFSDLDLSGADLVMNGRMDLWNHNAIVGGLNGNGMIFANDSSRRLTVGANNHSGTFTGILTNYSWASSATLGLLKTGTGVQTLSGASTYSGGTIVRAGQVSPAHASSLGNGVVTLGDSGTGTNTVTLAASTAVTINNSIVVSAQGNGPATIGTANISPGAVNMQYNGALTLNRDVVLQAGSTERTTFGGRITGAGGLNIVSPFAALRRVVLDRPSGSSNDFSGGVVIGTNALLQLGNNSSIGNRTLPDSVALGFAPGAQLRFAPSVSGDTETVGALISLVEGVGTLDMASATSFTLGFGARDGVFGGAIANTTGALALRKSGAGTQVLSGNSTYGGATTISGGTLMAASANALGSASGGTVVGLDATLALSNNISITVESLLLSGSGVANSGALRNDQGQNSFRGLITLGAPAKIRSQAGQLTLGACDLGANLLSLEAFNGTSLVVAGAVSGSGGIEKLGTGSLTLLDANQFTGPTLITEGMVVLESNGAIANSSAIVVRSLLDVAGVSGGWVLGAGQTLSGDGLVVGTVTGPGTLEPGESIGTLMVQGDVTLAGTTVVEIAKTGSLLTNDLLACSGTLITGGTLVVTNAGVGVPVPGNEFRLFAASTFGPGAFSSVTLPQIPGIGWDISRLNTEGILTAITGEPSEPPSLSLTSSNGSLTISWPTNYTSYALQAQTNSPGAGLTSAWFPVPGVTSNSFTFPLDAAAGSVFYRLMK